MREILLHPEESLEYVCAHEVVARVYFFSTSTVFCGDYRIPYEAKGLVYLGKREIYNNDSGRVLVDPRPFILCIKHIFEYYIAKYKLESAYVRLNKFLLKVNACVSLFANVEDFEAALHSASERYSSLLFTWEQDVWGSSYYTWYRGMIIGIRNKKIELSFEYTKEGIYMSWKYLDELYDGNFWKKMLPWPMYDEKGELFVL